MSAYALAELIPREQREKMAARTVLGRLVAPEDVARAIAALVHGAMEGATGEVIRIDGGLRRSG